MLIAIGKDEVVNALNYDLVKNCGEAIEIVQSGVGFYTDSRRDICNNRMVEYKLRDLAAFEIVSEDSLFINECIMHINKLSLSAYYLYVPIDYVLSPLMYEGYNAIKLSDFADYILDPSYKIEQCQNSSNIITLRKEHEAIANQFKLDEDISGRPSFSTLFRVMILENKLEGGKIYAYLQQNKIVAYLSCYIFRDNIYDIDHIYVMPEYRRQEIGVQLVKHYINCAISSGYIPRYGNAKNANSRKLAQKSGFAVVKYQKKYKMIKESR